MEIYKIDDNTRVEYNEDYAVIIQGNNPIIVMNDMIVVNKNDIEWFKSAILHVQYEWDTQLSNRLKHIDDGKED